MFVLGNLIGAVATVLDVLLKPTMPPEHAESSAVR